MPARPGDLVGAESQETVPGERTRVVVRGSAALVQGISRTALGVGILRAMHRMVDREPWVIDDPVSPVLFDGAVRAMMERDPSAYTGPAGDALRGHVLVRSAFAEERLRCAIERGVRQCVVLGAGYDTFAYRQPAWASRVRLFEVDAPATQADKRARLAATGIAEPANVVYAPIDFEHTSLAAGLADAGFNAQALAFFSWLGVMVYLTRDAVDAVFRFVARMPRGSEIAFTFSAPRPDDTRLASRVAALGEPLRTRIDVLELERMLRDFGFRETTVLTPGAAQRLLGTRSDTLRLPPRESIAAALL